MNVYGKTDQGRVRANNQDTFLTDLQGELGYLVLCDGMGGARAGNVASEKAAARFLQEMKDNLPECRDTDALAALAEHAAAKANEEVYALSQSAPEYQGMGTTLIGGICVEDRVILANIGDSRAYVLEGSRIAQMTTDHSLVAEMIRTGRLTPEQARSYPGRNLITRAIGVDADVGADLYEITLQDNQILLLCSDGLYGMVTDEEIAAAIQSSQTLEEAGDQLVSIALEAGGHDNITVVLYMK